MRVADCVLILTLFGSALYPAAWQSNWKIQGRVTDRGQPAANATVKATNVETGETRETVTNQNGDYIFMTLQRGRYRIMVYLNGYLAHETDEFEIGPTLPDKFDLELNTPKFRRRIHRVEDATPEPAPVPATASPTITPIPAPRGEPSTTPASTQSGSNLDQIFKNLSVGNIAFNAPGEMRLEETVSIQLALSPAKTIEELKQVIQEPGRIETAQIKISEFMEAKLVGSGFVITEITPLRQFVSKTEDTVWRWDIRAVRPGKQRLNLSLNVILEESGRESVKSLRTFSKDIEIEVSFAERVKGFVANNWQWLWATLVVPIAAWLLRRYSAKKNQTGQ